MCVGTSGAFAKVEGFCIRGTARAVRGRLHNFCFKVFDMEKGYVCVAGGNVG